MLLLTRQQAGKSFGPQNGIALFGLGLIGSHILKHLLGQGYEPAARLPFDWQDRRERAAETAAIAGRVTSLIEAGVIRETKDTPVTTDVVWCAGSGGFGMDEAEADQEFSHFQDVVRLATALENGPAAPLVRFHLISSAGGLFEGQRSVELTTPAAPKRCYSRLKLRQENTLRAVNGLMGFIYRPSSVYGLSGAGKRRGLIPTLLMNGSRYQVSTIYGTPDTLRDYVPAQDVGRFIAAMLASSLSRPETFHLVSGVSRSLADVQKTVEQAINRKLYICYRSDKSNNTADITFSPRSLPANWTPHGIDTTVRILWHAFMR